MMNSGLAPTIAVPYTGPRDGFRDRMARNGSIAQDFRWAVSQCNINQIPDLIRKLLEKRAWERRLEASLYYQHKSLVDFITMPPMDGCGWEVGKVEALLKQAGDAEVLALWEAAFAGEHAQEINQRDSANQRAVGTNQYSEGVDNEKMGVNTRPDGNSESYAHRRLRKDRPDIHARVLAGEISAHAGMVEAGFRKPRKSHALSTLEKLRRAWNNATPAERAAFLAEVKKEEQ